MSAIILSETSYSLISVNRMVPLINWFTLFHTHLLGLFDLRHTCAPLVVVVVFIKCQIDINTI